MKLWINFPGRPAQRQAGIRRCVQLQRGARPEVSSQEVSATAAHHALHLNLNDELSPTGHLGRYFPDGIDIYFENGGGEMLANMNTYGRVALSGVISEYTGAGRRVVLRAIASGADSP